MDAFLYTIRDGLVGTHYFIYAFILSIFMFAMIGYLFKQKYGKLDVILGNQTQVTLKSSKNKKNKKNIKKNASSPDLLTKNIGLSETIKSQVQTPTVPIGQQLGSGSGQIPQTTISQSVPTEVPTNIPNIK